MKSSDIVEEELEKQIEDLVDQEERGRDKRVNHLHQRIGELIEENDLLKEKVAELEHYL